MKYYHIKNNLPKYMLIFAAAISAGSCTDDFLEPDPLSIYEPTKTFTTREALESALAMCDRHLRNYWTYYSTQDLSLPISTEYMFSDLAVAAKTDESAIFADIASRLTPTNSLENNNTNRIMFFWEETYNGIKYANTVTEYIDKIPQLDETTRNEFKGRAYFHRAFRYLALCFQFNNVPLVTHIISTPKLNYRSTRREAILKMITMDMEKAVQWVPSQSEMEMIGMANKEACRQLLIKCYLSTGQFEKAKLQADTLIEQSGHALMQENFGTFSNPNPKTWNITENVIWDLHRPENKTIAENKEALLVMPNRQGTTAAVQMRTMRNWLPLLDTDMLMSPDGQKAVEFYAKENSDGSANKYYNEEMDYNITFGRGIAHIRPTYFATHSLWTVNGVDDTGDLRHSTASGNWVTMESLKYNHLNPRQKQWYGKPLRLYGDDGKLLCSDTIRCWFDWPHYKTYIPSDEEMLPTSTNLRGGAGDWYCFRLAETYLLRAEAKFYLGDPTATDDVNAVRQRAHCQQLYSTVTIDDIMDERARELYMEEWRHMELSRVSYCLALSGKPDKWGNTYNVNQLAEKSLWFERITRYNNYYNKNIVEVKDQHYTLAAHNIYWPIPQNKAINANRDGQLMQNPGYDGYDPNVPVWDNWEDAVADEYSN